MSTEPAAGKGAKRSHKGWIAAPAVAFAALALLFIYALEKGGDPSRLPSALIGRPVPKTEFPPLEGLVDGTRPIPGFSSADLAKGGVSVVNFWASWCVPCTEEQPLLIALRERAPIALFGVNYKDSTTSARRFLGRYGNPFDAVGVDSNGRGAIEWGVYGMPETFVVTGKGEIAFKHVGPISEASLRDELLPAIAAAAKAETAQPKP